MEALLGFLLKSQGIQVTTGPDWHTKDVTRYSRFFENGDNVLLMLWRSDVLVFDSVEQIRRAITFEWLYLAVPVNLVLVISRKKWTSIAKRVDSWDNLQIKNFRDVTTEELTGWSKDDVNRLCETRTESA